MYFYVFVFMQAFQILNTAPDEHNQLELIANIDHLWFVIGLAL